MKYLLIGLFLVLLSISCTEASPYNIEGTVVAKNFIGINYGGMRTGFGTFPCWLISIPSFNDICVSADDWNKIFIGDTVYIKGSWRTSSPMPYGTLITDVKNSN